MGHSFVTLTAWHAHALSISGGGTRWGRLILIASGFALGLAISAKVFAVFGGIPIACLLLGSPHSRRTRISNGAWVLAGLTLYIAFEGAFFAWAAHDPLFNFHAHVQAGSIETPTTSVGHEGEGFAAQLWDRIAMMLHPGLSGWGTMGVLFWPALLAAGICGGRVRWLAVWAAAAYLGVALMPVDSGNGLRINPLFHGRHVLGACVPFALCLGWAAPAIFRLATTRAVGAGFGLSLVGVFAVGIADRRDLNGFRDRETSRIAATVVELVRDTRWAADRPVYMTPSTFWRFRILFPPELRDRLRVATADEAPDWWKTTTPDIAERRHPLPPPDQAYLLATPRQVAGDTEYWDYGVGLPREQLTDWADTAVVGRDTGRAAPLDCATSHDVSRRILLLSQASRVGVSASNTPRKRIAEGPATPRED